jgi:cellulose synthase operon protein B
VFRFELFIPVEPLSVSTAADRNAIFVGTIGALQPQVVAQVGISPDSARLWSDGTTTSAIDSGEVNNDEAFDRWREKLSGRGWYGTVSVLQDWLTRNFDFSVGSLRLLPGSEPDYTPARGESLVVAQQASPSGTTTWTVVTAPTDDALADGVRALTAAEDWSSVGGRVAALDDGTGTISTVPAESFSFVETQPFSIANYRLIVANWLSGNPLSYALILFVACSLLGLVTAQLLSKLGRRT